MIRVRAGVLLLVRPWLRRAGGRAADHRRDHRPDHRRLGRHAAGVTVTIRGAGVAGAPTVVTSEDGDLPLSGAPARHLRAGVRAQGFSTLKRDAIPVAVGSTVEIDVTLKSARSKRSITVQGAAPVVNAASAEVSTTYNREWVENAPTSASRTSIW